MAVSQLYYCNLHYMETKVKLILRSLRKVETDVKDTFICYTLAINIGNK